MTPQCAAVGAEGCMDLAALYNDVFASLGNTVRKASRVKAEISPAEVEEQCVQIDELWVELGYCCHKWRGYPAAFIASRFANMHYVKQTGAGYAYPPDDVWTYLVNKVTDYQRGKVVIMLKRTERGVVRAWK